MKLKLILWTIIFILPARSQGLYWESSTVIPVMGDKERHSKTYYMPKMFKEAADSGETSTIIRLDKELFIIVNDKDSTYSEMTFSEMESSIRQMGGTLKSKLAAMREKLKDMPEDQRKMVEKLMGKSMTGGEDSGEAYSVDRGKEKKTISGYPCVQNIVKQGDKDLFTVWTTKDIKGYGEMGNELKEFVQKIASMVPVNGKSLAEGYKQIDGFPVKTEMAAMSTTVTKIERRTTPAAAFEVPAGYKKVKPKWLQGLERGEE